MNLERLRTRELKSLDGFLMYVSACVVARACAYVEGLGNQTTNVEEHTHSVHADCRWLISWLG